MTQSQTNKQEPEVHKWISVPRLQKKDLVKLILDFLKFFS